MPISHAKSANSAHHFSGTLYAEVRTSLLGRSFAGSWTTTMQYTIVFIFQKINVDSAPQVQCSDTYDFFPGRHCASMGGGDQPNPLVTCL